MVLSMERWYGKTAVVTGASVGIGAAIVEALLNEGVQVVAIARRKDKLEELSKRLSNKKGTLHIFVADVSREEDVLNAFKWIKDNLGPVHILINNAGIGKQTSLIEGKTEYWKNIFDVNVLGLCVATREAVKSMRENSINGHIVHLNSLSGHRVISTIPNLNVYPASKFAVTALTETLRQELNSIDSKIKITSVSPGTVDTDFALDIRKTDKAVDEAFSRGLKPEDVADAVVYALSTPPHVQIHEVMMRSVHQKF